MIFIETPVFTEEILQYLTDEEYREFQNILLIHPEAGKIISGSNGLRKIRWKLQGMGKRGGLRIIYYWDVSALVPFNFNELISLVLRGEKQETTSAQITQTLC